jgi:hypothetical protein
MRIRTGFSIWLGTAVACFAGEKESLSLQGRPPHLAVKLRIDL